MALREKSYPASFDIDYPKEMDRLTTFFRLIWSIPAFILLALLTGGFGGDYTNEAGNEVAASAGGIMVGLFVATALMILFRRRYPKWWFDFALELNRFTVRVGSYMLLLTDKYPSTVEHQSVRLDAKYPDVPKDLNRWLPLIKWLLALPHYIILIFLVIAAFFATIIAWFAILVSGRYPKNLFDFVVGVGRWNWRVTAYTTLLTTDEYPPFSLK